jgi:hypothetical protein
MNLSKIFSEAVLIDEDYPESFNMDEFKSLTSFKKRVAYCRQHLHRLAQGSSRIAYQVDDTKVLKLAKNKKGLAQNYTEYSLSKDNMCGDIVAQTFDAHPDDLWIEMELALPVSKNDMKEFFGCTPDELLVYLEKFYYTHVTPSEHMAHMDYLADNVQKSLDEHDFIHELKHVMEAYVIHPADFCKNNSYGKVQRNGRQEIVLIDYGITDEVYSTYYTV